MLDWHAASTHTVGECCYPRKKMVTVPSNRACVAEGGNKAREDGSSLMHAQRMDNLRSDLEMTDSNFAANSGSI